MPPDPCPRPHFSWQQHWLQHPDGDDTFHSARSPEARPAEGSAQGMLKDTYEDILRQVKEACQRLYGERLVSLAVFGSVARGTEGPDSDVDLLIVADPLPRGRMPRVREFHSIDRALAPHLEAAAGRGIRTRLSPIFKTPEEVARGSLLFLDMTDQARILVDRDGFLASYLRDLSSRLESMGARRVQRAGGYYWLLKPDLKPGEEIDL